MKAYELRSLLGRVKADEDILICVTMETADRLKAEIIDEQFFAITMKPTEVDAESGIISAEVV